MSGTSGHPYRVLSRPVPHQDMQDKHGTCPAMSLMSRICVVTERRPTDLSNPRIDTTVMNWVRMHSKPYLGLNSQQTLASS
jgi:hypothetical protein